MHVMLRRATVTTGALSALLGLAGSPCYAVAASHTAQTPVRAEAADGTSHGPGTKAGRESSRTASPSGVSPRQAQTTWSCSALLDSWDDPVQCPGLSSGFYTFKNASPGNDGIYVYICDATPNADSCNSPGTAFLLDDPGDTQVAAVPPGYDVYIGGLDLVEHEQLVLSATPYTSGS